MYSIEYLVALKGAINGLTVAAHEAHRAGDWAVVAELQVMRRRFDALTQAVQQARIEAECAMTTPPTPTADVQILDRPWLLWARTGPDRVLVYLARLSVTDRDEIASACRAMIRLVARAEDVLAGRQRGVHAVHEGANTEEGQ